MMMIGWIVKLEMMRIYWQCLVGQARWLLIGGITLSTCAHNHLVPLGLNHQLVPLGLNHLVPKELNHLVPIGLVEKGYFNYMTRPPLLYFDVKLILKLK